MSELQIRTVYPTWPVYPRVQYFRNRFLSLYPRFARTVGSVQWKVQDYLEAIKSWFEGDLEIKVITKSVFPNERFIVDRTSLPESTHKSDGKEITKARVFLCYIEGQDARDPQFIQSLKDVLEVLNKEHSSEECLLYFAVNLFKKPLEKERTIIQNNLDEQLKWRPISWDKSWSVVFEIDSTDIPVAISDYFEQQLVEGFSVMAKCLELFIPSEDWFKKDEKHLDNLKEFSENSQAPHSVAFVIRDLEKPKASELKIGLESLSSLARMIKCQVLFPFYEQLSLSSYVYQEILVNSQFESQFKISSSTESLLLDIKEKEIEKKVESMHKHPNLVKSIIQDIWPLVNAIAIEYDKRSTTCTKMLFEVNGYLEQSRFGKKICGLMEAPYVPKRIRRKLLGIKGVYCIGTVYNQFTVYLERMTDDENVKRTRLEINEVMKNHNCGFHWLIKKVTKPSRPLANMQYENGNAIRSRGSATEFRNGTLGSFVMGNNGKTYAITCAHVVSNPLDHEDVFIKERQGRNDDYHLFARSYPNLTVSFAETSCRLIDVAALEIINNFERLCGTAMKDEDGLNRHWAIWDAQGTNILYKNVFKYGGSSGLTFGIISSADIELPQPALPVTSLQATGSYLVMIDNMPGSDGTGSPFSVQGDSGSVVCVPRVLDNAYLMDHADATRITAVSMIHLGELQVGRELSDQTLSFSLKPALHLLSTKSNVEFRPP